MHALPPLAHIPTSGTTAACLQFLAHGPERLHFMVGQPQRHKGVELQQPAQRQPAHVAQHSAAPHLLIAGPAAAGLFESSAHKLRGSPQQAGHKAATAGQGLHTGQHTVCQAPPHLHNKAACGLHESIMKRGPRCLLPSWKVQAGRKGSQTQLCPGHNANPADDG